MSDKELVKSWSSAGGACGRSRRGWLAVVLVATWLVASAPLPTRAKTSEADPQAWLAALAAARGVDRAMALRAVGPIGIVVSTPPGIRDALPDRDREAAIFRGLDSLGLRFDAHAPAHLALRFELNPYAVTRSRGEEEERRTPLWQVSLTAAIRAPITVLREDRFFSIEGVLASATVAQTDVDAIAPDTVRWLIDEAFASLARDAALDDGPLRTDEEWKRQLTGAHDAAALWRDYRDRQTETDGPPWALAGVRRFGGLVARASPLNDYPPLDLALGDATTSGNPFARMMELEGARRQLARAPVKQWDEGLVRLGLSFYSGWQGRTLPDLVTWMRGFSSVGAQTYLAQIVVHSALVEPECLLAAEVGYLRFACRAWETTEVGAALAGPDTAFGSAIGQAIHRANGAAVASFERAYRAARDRDRARGLDRTAALGQAPPSPGSDVSQLTTLTSENVQRETQTPTETVEPPPAPEVGVRSRAGLRTKPAAALDGTPIIATDGTVTLTEPTPVVPRIAVVTRVADPFGRAFEHQMVEALRGQMPGNVSIAGGSSAVDLAATFEDWASALVAEGFHMLVSATIEDRRTRELRYLGRREMLTEGRLLVVVYRLSQAPTTRLGASELTIGFTPARAEAEAREAVVETLPAVDRALRTAIQAVRERHGG